MAELKRGAVLITGASTGIGRAGALHLDQLGFEVFASVRKEADGRELCAQASKRLKPILLDITDPSAIAQAKAEIASTVGAAGLWGLVNNAGISFRAPLEFAPLDEVRKLFDVNVFGTLSVTQAFLPLLRQARGRIVNISSITAFTVSPFHGPYSSSKACLNALTHALRMEVKPAGIQVSLVLCGGVQTAIWEKVVKHTTELSRQYPPPFSELYAAKQQKALDYFVSRGRKGVLPEVVARAIAHALTAKRAKQTYLAGPDARFYHLLDKLLYGRLRDWVILRSLGMRY